MLRDFLTANRPELIQRCRAKVAKRRAPRATPAELEHGIPLFLSQLTGMMPTGTVVPKPSSAAETEIEDGAAQHGRELLRNDFTIEQVVHDYGDLCQSITELASEQSAPISVDEFGILNIRLDNAIAGAVTEYALQHQRVRANAEELATNERLGLLAGEMRNLLNTTILAISAIKRGSVGFGGATAAALDRSLLAMRDLIDRTLVEVRLADDVASLLEVIEIGPFIADVQVAATLDASSRGCELTLAVVEPGIFVEADRHILASAVSNLLHNAFKYTRRDSHVMLSAHAKGGKVFIDVEDESGPMAPDPFGQQIDPFEHRTSVCTAAGIGLSIARKGVEASGGKLSARVVPGKGCLFTVALPEKTWHEQRNA